MARCDMRSNRRRGVCERVRRADVATCACCVVREWWWGSARGRRTAQAAVRRSGERSAGRRGV
eukprot:3142990-Prymnesium_polylepis.1